MHGQISDPMQMQALYGQSHVIILTSAYEGFPMTIKEGMAQGCIPVVTALPGNKTHLRPNENALLLNTIDDEDEVVREGIEHLYCLCRDIVLRARLGKAAFLYAKEMFDRDSFMRSYAEILY